MAQRAGLPGLVVGEQEGLPVDDGEEQGLVVPGTGATADGADGPRACRGAVRGPQSVALAATRVEQERLTEDRNRLDGRQVVRIVERRRQPGHASGPGPPPGAVGQIEVVAARIDHALAGRQRIGEEDEGFGISRDRGPGRGAVGAPHGGVVLALDPDEGGVIGAEPRGPRRRPQER